MRTAHLLTVFQHAFPGGCTCPRGCTCPGVPAQGVYLPIGVYLPRVGYVPRGYLPGTPPPPVNRMTDRQVYNHNLRKLRLRAVTNEIIPLKAHCFAHINISLGQPLHCKLIMKVALVTDQVRHRYIQIHMWKTAKARECVLIFWVNMQTKFEVHIIF